ncbi:uncharacterized protein IWZ02DRAFT_189811 [Phyllosticta citriasiana]|uniref:uncharacterized protein n=1 Tax=Phyllosticta citriasiana TaxID=595635 RepID=UPI0030FD5214
MRLLRTTLHLVNKQQQKRSTACKHTKATLTRLLAPSPTLCRPTKDVRWRRLCSARLIRVVRLRRWLRKTRLPYVDNGQVGVLTAVARRGQRMLQTPFQYQELPGLAYAELVLEPRPRSGWERCASADWQNGQLRTDDSRPWSKNCGEVGKCGDANAEGFGIGRENATTTTTTTTRRRRGRRQRQWGPSQFFCLKIFFLFSPAAL